MNNRRRGLAAQLSPIACAGSTETIRRGLAAQLPPVALTFGTEQRTRSGLAAQPPPDRAGWSIVLYCQLCSFSRATYYNLPPELKPRSVKIGKRHIIIEPPADYLARLASAQEAELA